MYDAKAFSPQLQRRTVRMTFRSSPAIFSDIYYLQETLGLPCRTSVLEHLIRIAGKQIRAENDIGGCNDGRQASDDPKQFTPLFDDHSPAPTKRRNPTEYKVVEVEDGGWVPICPVEYTIFRPALDDIRPGDFLVPVCGEGKELGRQYPDGVKTRYIVRSNSHGNLRAELERDTI